jgi:hypothetical protein
VPFCCGRRTYAMAIWARVCPHWAAISFSPGSGVLPGQCTSWLCLLLRLGPAQTGDQCRGEPGEQKRSADIAATCDTPRAVRVPTSSR